MEYPISYNPANTQWNGTKSAVTEQNKRKTDHSISGVDVAKVIQMINIKLKSWIDGQTWFGETVRAVTKNKELPSLDFNDLAFKLTTRTN